MAVSKPQRTAHAGAAASGDLLFVLVTAPMSSHAIAEAAPHQAHAEEEVPGSTTLDATAEVDRADEP